LLANLVINIFLLPTLYVWAARQDDIVPPGDESQEV
jgi:hypothetical protein